jgi:hypothetical protein
MKGGADCSRQGWQAVSILSDVGTGMDAPVSYQLRYVNSKEEGGVADR